MEALPSAHQEIIQSAPSKGLGFRAQLKSRDEKRPGPPISAVDVSPAQFSGAMWLPFASCRPSSPPETQSRRLHLNGTPRDPSAALLCTVVVCGRNETMVVKRKHARKTKRKVLDASHSANPRGFVLASAGSGINAKSLPRAASNPTSSRRSTLPRAPVVNLQILNFSSRE